MVYDAGSEHRTPDEEIAARLEDDIAKLEGNDSQDELVSSLLTGGVMECMNRHKKDSCYECQKFGECCIHKLDIDYASGDFKKAGGE